MQVSAQAAFGPQVSVPGQTGMFWHFPVAGTQIWFGPQEMFAHRSAAKQPLTQVP
jgi:hypothetical protein